MTTLKSTLDVEAMQQRLDEAEQAWLDGDGGHLRAAGCASRPQ